MSSSAVSSNPKQNREASVRQSFFCNTILFEKKNCSIPLKMVKIKAELFRRSTISTSAPFSIRSFVILSGPVKVTTS